MDIQRYIPKKVGWEAIPRWARALIILASLVSSCIFMAIYPIVLIALVVIGFLVGLYSVIYEACE